MSWLIMQTLGFELQPVVETHQNEKRSLLQHIFFYPGGFEARLEPQIRHVAPYISYLVLGGLENHQNKKRPLHFLF